jgi:hypothetical protein
VTTEDLDLFSESGQRRLTSSDKTDTPSSDAHILDTISAHLTPEAQRNLTALANTSVALDMPDTDPETYIPFPFHPPP